MLTIELKMLPGEANAATNFLRSKIQGQIQIHGESIEIEEAKAQEVKLLLHKFLHDEGLTGYRVLSQQGILRVEPDNRPSREEQPMNEKTKGTPPFPPLSGERLPLMDTVYPNYASQGSGYKKKKR